MIWRWMPLAGALVASAVMAWRLWWQRRRYGSDGLVIFQSSRWTQRMIGVLGVMVILVLFMQALVFAVRPETISIPRAVAFLTTDAPRIVGAIMMFGGIALMLAAQLGLGASYRMGIPEGAAPGLVTGGFYRFTRNPIYLFVFVMLAGYVVLIPTLVSFVIFVGVVIGIRQQVLTEEAYLIRTYGDAYRDYARRVGRFLPGAGTIP